MRFLFFLLSFVCLTARVSAQPDTTQKRIPGRKNSLEQQQKPYVILISADGFRYDYAEKYQAHNLLALSENGARATSMFASFPSLTYPNHYTIITGLYPAHHGLVDNKYFDRGRNDMYAMADHKKTAEGSRYGGTPLWVLAEEQQMISASFYWVGSEADIKGILPSYYYQYNEIIPIDKRISVVVDWLKLPEEIRPHFITFYFPEVDHSGHVYGPDAPQTRQAVNFVDESILKLTQAVSATGLPVNFIFVSDHGMTNVDTAHAIPIMSKLDTSRFITNNGAQVLQLYARNKKDIYPYYKRLKKEQQGYKVYLKNKMPERFNYRSSDDRFNKIGDIILLPDWPKVFKFDRKLNPGAHGFDPYRVKDMQATFYAWGPAFKKGVLVPSFKNIQVFRVITEILGLSVHSLIDGDAKLAHLILN